MAARELTSVTAARVASLVAFAAATALLVIGIKWGTFAAGGSDSYCYLNGAELLARGTLVDVEPLGTDPTWPGSPAAFAPTGHVSTPAPGSAVPIGPQGYPALMALARLVAGRQAMFWVTPLLGAVLAWCTFALACRITTPLGAAMAAVLTAASPIVLYQVVQPMNDVPATALWAAALAAATRRAWSLPCRASVAGLLTGVAFSIRPNLAPLAVVVGVGTCLLLPAGWKERVWGLIVFGVGALPGVVFVLVAQNVMFGSPFRSGYGDLGELFAVAHMAPNAQRYFSWLLGTHTPAILLALGAPLLTRGFNQRVAWLLVAFAAATTACYLPYVVFDAWWYLRFLLPAVPPLLILMMTTFVEAGQRVTGRAMPVVVVAATCALAWFFVETASQRQVFELRHLESRFRVAGEYAATLPPNAVILTEYQSGSVRFYSGRSSVRWSEIDPARLQEALAFLRRHGRKPYFLFERSEEAAFKAHFASHDPLGTLEWPPVADIDRVVHVFDPDDYSRYMSGVYVPTQQVRSRRR
jgi:hypothetical protein